MMKGDLNPAKRPEVREKMSNSQKERLKNKCNHPNYNKHLKEKTRKKISETLKRKYASGEIKKPHLGKKFSKEHCANISKNHWTKNPAYQGINHPSYKRKSHKYNWEYNDYSTLFTKEFKKEIFDRDNYTCQICNKRGGVLHCHHIDYNKRRTSYINCITLCNSCHAKTNNNREYWMKQLGYKHNKYSLFLGRFQCLPPHEGHQQIIKTVLNEGKNILIGIRESDGTDNNPYSLYERLYSIEKMFKKEILNDKIIVMDFPNVVEIAYGRDVGWNIREIKVSEEIEKISATEIRKNEKR